MSISGFMKQINKANQVSSIEFVILSAVLSVNYIQISLFLFRLALNLAAERKDWRRQGNGPRRTLQHNGEGRLSSLFVRFLKKNIG